ncbi:MAG: MlaD family protein [Burkholderiales bacterium]|nr:MlaD family protein [Burkholderiales bacterium]
MTKENKQYLLVGVFVILTMTILLSVWLWFTSSNRQSYNIYITTFSEPVDGLSINSAVKYSGVEVGRVKKIVLDQANPRNIIIYLNILTSVNINQETVATLKSIGVTGISYIGLLLPKNANLKNNLTPHNSKPYPQIRTQASLLYNLSEQAQSVSNNIQDISGHFKQILSNQNIKEFSEILNNLNKTTKAITDNGTHIADTIKDLSVIVANIKNSTKNINKTISNINNLTQSLINTSNSTNNLINNFSNTTLNNINYNLLPNLNQTILQINQTSYQLGLLIDTINQNPNSLIRGVENKPTGPGE